LLEPKKVGCNEKETKAEREEGEGSKKKSPKTEMY